MKKRKYVSLFLSVIFAFFLLPYVVHASPFTISVTNSVLTIVADTSISGSMSGAMYQNAGFIGGLPIDLKATVLSFSQNNGTGAIIFAKSGDDPSVRITSGHALIKWEVFEAGTSVPAYGDVDFTISDIDAYSIQNLGGAIGVVNVIPTYPIESVSADLTGLYSYTTDTATNISFSNDGTKIKAANLISNQNGEPQSNVKFSWKNISSWQLSYDVESHPLGLISYDQSPYDTIIDGTFSLNAFGQRFFNNDADGDLVFLSPRIVGIAQLDLDGDNSTAVGMSYLNSFTEGATGSLIVDGDMFLSHASSPTLNSARIILSNRQLGDVLSISGLPLGMSSSLYDPLTGILTLSGTATLLEYETALKSILFANTTQNPNTNNRIIQISVSDGTNNSDIALSTIQVNALNDIPTTMLDTFVVVKNMISPPLNILGNDSDVDGDTLTLKSIEGTLLTPGTAQEITSTHGTIFVSASGSITFLSSPNYNGGTTFSYVVEDGNGGEASGVVNLEVLLSPLIPTLSFSQNPSSTGAVTITGTGTANTTIEIKDISGLILCSTTVSPLGEYTCGPLSPAPLSTSVLTINSCDPTYTFNCSFANATLIIDNIAPFPPSILSVEGDTVSPYTTNNNNPTLTGTGEANSFFIIKGINDTIIATGSVDTSGNWSTIPCFSNTGGCLAFPEGLTNFSVTLTDSLGNMSLLTTSSFFIDTLAPATPTLANPTQGLLTNDPTPTINGTGEAGSIFEIRDIGGNLVGTGVVDGSGNYTFTPTSNLPQGANTLSVTLTDAVGNISIALVRNFIVDTTAPSPLTLTSPINGSLIQDATPTINGTGEAGSIFEIRDIGGNLVGTGVVDGSGNYTFTPTSNLPEGTNTFFVTLTDAAGNTGTSVNTTFTIDTLAPSTSNSTLDLQASSDSGNSNTDNTTSDHTPSFDVVCSEIGSTIRVYSGTQVLASSPCLSVGLNSVTLAPALIDGVYILHYTETDLAGNESGNSPTLQITIDTTAPASLSGNIIPNDDSGTSNTDNITNDATPTIIGTGEARSTFEIRNTSGSFVGTGMVDESGNYNFTPSSNLPEGINTLAVTLRDVAGNTSTPVNTTFTLDTTVPSTPTLTNLYSGIVIKESSFLITGIGEIGSIMSVNIGTQSFTGIVDTTGNWSILASGLVNGNYTPTIFQTDSVGNQSPSLTLNFLVILGFDQFNSGGGNSSKNASSSNSINLSNTINPFIENEKTNVSIPEDINNVNNEDTKVAPISQLGEQDQIKNNVTFFQKKISQDLVGNQEKTLNYLRTLSGTTLPIFELKNRITDHICPVIVKINDVEELLSEESLGNVSMQSVLMFRGLEKGEENGEATFIEAKDQGIAKNVNLFDANRDVTRAEYVKMIVRSLSCRYTYVGTDTGFRDVEENIWYAAYIKFAVDNGWINGYEDGNFRPNSPISKEEAAKILTRAIQLPVQEGNSNFSDVKAESIFAKYISTLKYASVIVGKEEDKFYPGDYITRNEAAGLIYRTFLGGLE